MTIFSGQWATIKNNNNNHGAFNWKKWDGFSFQPSLVQLRGRRGRNCSSAVCHCTKRVKNYIMYQKNKEQRRFFSIKGPAWLVDSTLLRVPRRPGLRRRPRPGCWEKESFYISLIMIQDSGDTTILTDPYWTRSGTGPPLSERTESIFRPHLMK